VTIFTGTTAASGDQIHATVAVAAATAWRAFIGTAATAAAADAAFFADAIAAVEYRFFNLRKFGLAITLHSRTVKEISDR
jgi:hypothetical protein